MCYYEEENARITRDIRRSNIQAAFVVAACICGAATFLYMFDVIGALGKMHPDGMFYDPNVTCPSWGLSFIAGLVFAVAGIIYYDER